MERVENVAGEFRKAAHSQMAATTQRTIRQLSPKYKYWTNTNINTHTGQIQILNRENVNISQQLAQLTEKATNLTSENDKLTLKVDLEVVEVEVEVENEVEL